MIYTPLSQPNEIIHKGPDGGGDCRVHRGRCNTQAAAPVEADICYIQPKALLGCSDPPKKPRDCGNTNSH